MHQTARTGSTLLSLTILAITLCSGCATDPTASASLDSGGEVDLPNYDGPRARIAVRRFEWKVGGRGAAGNVTVTGPNGPQTISWSASQTNGYAGGFTDMMTRSLMSTKRFVVLERAQFEDVRDEVRMKEDGWVTEGSGPSRGKAIGADLGIYGAVVGFEPKAKSSSFGIGAILSRLPFPFLSALKIGTERSAVSLEVRVFDLNTSEVLSSTTVKGEATSRSLGFGGAGWGGGAGLLGGLGEFEKTPMDQAIRVAVAEAVREIVNETPAKYMRF